MIEQRRRKELDNIAEYRGRERGCVCDDIVDSGGRGPEEPSDPRPLLFTTAQRFRKTRYEV